MMAYGVHSSTKNSNFRAKEFRQRESLFSTLYDSRKDIQFLCKLTWIATLVYITTKVVYRVANGSIREDIHWLSWTVNDVPVVIINWMYLQVDAIMIYYLTRLWVGNKIPSTIYASLFTIGFAWTFYIVCRPSVWNEIFPLPRIILIIVQMGLAMKIVAFMLESAKKRKKNLNSIARNVDGDICSLGHFVYFLFAPTLVFCDHYVRSSRPTNWGRVSLLIAYTLGYVIIFFDYFKHVFRPTCDAIFKIQSPDYQLTIKGVMTIVGVGYGQGILVFIGSAFIFLHALQNVSAEILRFGDRQFYTDWWNQGDIMNYLRTWNLLIGDWIFEYAYVPVKGFFGSEPLTFYTIIFVSAVLHDYLIASLTGFIVPFYTFIYPLGVQYFRLFTWMSNRISIVNAIKENMTKGQAGALFTLLILANWAYWILVFTLEYYCRNYLCPTPSKTLIDTLRPRLLTCIQWKLTVEWTDLTDLTEFIKIS